MNTPTTLPTVTITDTRFGKLRTVTLEGHVWFVATDVCKALGLTHTSSALANCNSTTVGEVRLSTRGGRPHKVVNEFGMNELVLQSRKPSARALRKLLTHEVLPSLYKHGIYIAGQESMTDDELRVVAGERAERLIEGTRAERHARIAADTKRFIELHGRAPNARERFFVAKP